MIPLRVGCPIRTSMDQSLLAAPHGFSQRATSFIASWCQGIHRMPFSYSIPRSSPNGRQPHHAQKPSPENKEDDFGNLCFRTQQDLLKWPSRRTAHAIRKTIHPTKPLTAPLNPRRRPLGRRPHRPNATHSSQRTTIPGQTSRPNDGTFDPSADRPSITRAQRRTRT